MVAATYAATSKPAHQASACQPYEPIGAPSSSPRSVSVIGVTGWFAATARSPAFIVSTGTKALDRYGRNSTRKVNPFDFGLQRILDGIEVLHRSRVSA